MQNHRWYLSLKKRYYKHVKLNALLVYFLQTVSVELPISVTVFKVRSNHFSIDQTFHYKQQI